MRRPLLLLALALGVPAVLLCARWLAVALAVGTGYAAKVTCSLVLNSGQDPERVLRRYVDFEVAPIGSWLRVEVGDGDVVASAAGLVRARAVHRRGLGCTLVHEGQPPAGPEALPRRARALDPREPWPEGAAGPERPVPRAVELAIDRAFAEPSPAPGWQRQVTAVVVAHRGQLVAERYAPGYGPRTPMLSWSMAKSVLASLVGAAVAEGRVSLEAAAPVPEWGDAGDPRAAITLDELLRMSSGLDFDERYGATNDVSRMLFTAPDAGAFAARSPLAAAPDTAWSYSSGTSNLVARVLRDAFGGDLAALVRFSRERLFDAADMISAFCEPDASGSFVASSFCFATARDWARLGELHRRGGLWRGRRVLPEAWVRYVTTPTPAAPDGRYGAHWWLNAGAPGDPARRPWPGLPVETYAARGHSGQWVVVVPPAELVVVRLGLGQRDDPDDGTPELVAELLRALAPGAAAAPAPPRTAQMGSALDH